MAEHHLPPSSICAVTFTNKAANEMRLRLVELVGRDATSQIKMGTFHALCATSLRKHAELVGVDTNFTICDAEERCSSISSFLVLLLIATTQQEGSDDITQTLYRLSQ